MKLSERLKILRKEKGVYQKDVAIFLGIDRTTYVKYETEVSEPDNETLIKLASYFKTTVDYLLGTTDDPSPPIVREEENIDVASNLEDVLKYLERETEGLMFFNEPMDDETREILIMNIKHTIELGKRFKKLGLPTSKQLIDELWAEVDKS